MRYYACFWVVPYIHDFNVLIKIVDKLAELDSELAELRQESIYSEGFISWHIALRVPSDAAFSQVYAITKEMLNMDNWYSIPQSLYLSGTTFDIRKLPYNDKIPFQKALDEDGIHNAGRQEWYENPEKQNTYHACHWIIEDEIPPNLLRAVKKAGELNCSLYFLNIELKDRYHTLYFGIRLPKKRSLKEFLKYTDTKSILVSFKRIKEEEFYLGSRLSVMGENWINRIVPDWHLKRLGQWNKELKDK